MTCGIYMIQNKVNGKIYVGQSVDIEERWRHHKGELRNNSHSNKHLQKAWNKDGEDNFKFTIVCECDESQLNTVEEYYIFELMTYEDEIGYNLNYGGGSGRPTEATKKKMAAAQKGAKAHLYGTHLPEETKKKISEALKGENNYLYGKHLPEETKKKISEAKKGIKGKPCSEETKRKIGEANKGKVRSEEVRKKMGEARRGKTLSEEHRRKISESLGKGFKNPASIPVVQITLERELVNVYGSASEAGRNGFNQKHVTSCCRGKRKTHGGYKWMYLSEYESMKKEELEK